MSTLTERIARQTDEALKLAQRIERATPLSELPSPARIKALREAAGKTRKQVAAALDIEADSWARYESGDRRPSGAVLLDVLRLLAVLKKAAS